MQEVTSLRERIAKVTSDIFELIAERNNLAVRLGKIKRESSMPAEDEQTENSLIDQVLSLSEQMGINKKNSLKILSTLFNESKRVQGIEQKSERVTPIGIASLARKLQESGVDVIRFDVGEPDFGPPQSVLDSCRDALYSGKTHYTYARGIPDLISSLAEYLKEKYGYEAGEENLLVTPGGRFAIFAAINTVLGEGESAVIIEPCWPAYRENLEFSNVRVLSLKTSIEEGWDPDTERLKEMIRKDTRAIILSYPSNPTGKIISRQKFKEIVEIAKDRRITLISDEIYNEYSYKECPTILDYPESDFILTSSFSKTWAMTGFRIGYAVSSKSVISKMLKILSLTMTCVPEFIQYGAIKALSAVKEVQENKRKMKERIDAACSSLDQIEKIEYYRPDGSMYVFPGVKDDGFDSVSFSSKLLNDFHVAVSPGSSFGDYRRYFRISLCQEVERLKKGIEIIGKYLQ